MSRKFPWLVWLIRLVLAEIPARTSVFDFGKLSESIATKGRLKLLLPVTVTDQLSGLFFPRKKTFAAISQIKQCPLGRVTSFENLGWYHRLEGVLLNLPLVYFWSSVWAASVCVRSVGNRAIRCLFHNFHPWFSLSSTSQALALLFANLLGMLLFHREKSLENSQRTS